MPLNPDGQALCDALLQARRSRIALPCSAATDAALPDDETAYALQLAQGVALGEWQPAALPRHWKSGGPRRDGPLAHAPLLPSGVQQSDASARGALDQLAFFQPMIEAEVALRLGSDVSPAQAQALTPHSAEALIDAMALSIEVVDSRWQSLAAAGARLKLADFQVHGALLLGPWQPWRDRDWAAQRGSVQFGDAAPTDFQGSHSLGTPQWLLPQWLRHLSRHGQTVPAGTVVTTGSWSGCVPVARGSRVRVRFDQLGELALTL